MFTATMSATAKPGPAHGISVILHGLTFAMVMMLTSSAPKVMAKKRSGPIYLTSPVNIRLAKPRLIQAQLTQPSVATLSEFRVPTRTPAKPKPVVPVAQPTLKLEPTPVAAAPAPQITLPKPVVQTDLFSGLTPPAPPKQNPALAVQAAGFAAADTASPTTRTARVMNAGFEGAANGPAGPARAGRVINAGFGANFGDATGTGPPTRKPDSVRAGGFGDIVVAAPTRPVARRDTSASTSGVEILSKPRPVYTEQARKLQIEGLVVLRVLFSASGQTQVLQVVRGLGHGLDEKAVEAAQQIRFRPAFQNGQAVDSTATVQISFQLAF